MELQFELPMDSGKKKTFMRAKADDCVISRFNTRKTRSTDDINHLAQRIERNGFEVTRALWAYAKNGKYEVFAGGNRLEAVRLTQYKDDVPLWLHEGFTDEDMARLETEDNENDEYHVKVSIVDTWTEYARLRDEEGWIQEKIARVKGVTQKWVSERLKYHDKMPEKIKSFMRQDKITEGHLEKIATLCVDAYFSPWLTTENLWLELADLAIKNSFSVAKLKAEVERWQKIIDAAKALYCRLDEQVEIGNIYHQIRRRFVDELAKDKAKTQEACLNAYKRVVAFIEVTRREYEKELERQHNEEAKKAHEAELERLRIELLQRYEPQIYYKSCFAMSEVEDQSIDLVFADPPYFLSDGGASCQSGKLVPVDKGEWDKADNPFMFNKHWIVEVKRKLKPSGSLYVSGTHHHIHEIGYILSRKGFKIINTIVWYKPNAAPSLIPRCFNHTTEFILFAVLSSEYKFNYDELKKFSNELHLTKGKEDAQLRNVWVINPPSSNEDMDYPTQKPEKLLEVILTASSKVGDLILDPFLGSGTTCAVAKRMKRRSIGYEINPANKAMIERRLDSVKVAFE